MINEIFDPTAMSIIQDTNFDPMAILKGDVKLDKETPIVNMKPKATDVEPEPDPNKKEPAPKVDLSDDMIIAGLQKAKGVEVPETPKDDDEPAAAGKSKKPVVPGSDDIKNAMAVHYNIMVDSGEWEPLEGFDGSEEKYLEARTLNDEKRAYGVAESWFKEAFENNPEGLEKGKLLFNHLKNGGKVADFVEMIAPAEFDFQNIHSEDDTVAEDASKELIRQYYSSIGWKPDKINTRITSLVKTGQIVDEAKQVEEPYRDLIQNRIEAETKRNASINAARQRDASELNNTIKTRIANNHSFGDLKIWNDKKERQSLEEYIYVADPETKRTAFSDELNKGLKDPDFLLFAAAALKNKWHKEGIKATAGDPDAAKAAATKDIKTRLEGALLNKRLSTQNSNDDQTSSSSQKSKFVFDLDKAVVIS